MYAALFTGVALYFAARLVDRGARFYLVAAIYSVLCVAYTELVTPGATALIGVAISWIKIFGISAVGLYYIDRYTDTLAAWLGIFALTLLTILVFS